MHALTLLLLALMALFSQALQPPEIARKNLHRKFNDTVFEHTRDFILTTDSIFTPRQVVHINPDYATFTKGLDLSPIHEAKDIMSDLYVEHEKVCDLMEHNDVSNRFQFTIPQDENNKTIHSTASVAKETCHDRGHTMVRAVSAAAQKSLHAYLTDNDIKEIYSDLAFSPIHNAILSPGTSISPTSSGFVRMCDEEQPASKSNIYAYFGTYYKQSLPLAYRRKGPYLTLCPVYENRPLATVCEFSRQPINIRTLDDEIAFCRARSNDIQNAILPLTSALNTLSHIVHPPKAGTNDREDRDTTGSQKLQNFFGARVDSQNIPSVPLNNRPSNVSTVAGREKRQIALATTAAVVGTMTMITSVVNSFANSAKYTENSRNIGKLSVQIDTLDMRTLQLEATITEVTDLYNNHVAIIENENRIYTSFLRIVASTQDNTIVYGHLLDSIMNAQMSTFMLSKDEIQTLATETLDRTSQRMSTNPTDYTVKPVYHNNHLSISIEIPLIDPSRQATIYSVRNFPIFRDQIQYVQDCDQEYIAIYENSDHYNTLTPTEYRDCITRRNRCTSSGPQFTKNVDNCLARQILSSNTGKVTHKKLSHSTPFFLTIGNKTIYSVPSPMRIEFHCPEIDKPGPDFAFTIADRGHFINPTGSCSFTTEGTSYIPPLQKVAVRTVFQDYFHMSTDPDLYNFPAKHSIDSLAVDSLPPLELTPSDSGEHASHISVIVVSTVLGITAFIVMALLYLYCALRRKVKRKVSKILSIIWEKDENDTEMSDFNSQYVTPNKYRQNSILKTRQNSRQSESTFQAHFFQSAASFPNQDAPPNTPNLDAVPRDIQPQGEQHPNPPQAPPRPPLNPPPPNRNNDNIMTESNNGHPPNPPAPQPRMNISLEIADPAALNNRVRNQPIPDLANPDPPNQAQEEQPPTAEQQRRMEELFRSQLQGGSSDANRPTSARPNTPNYLKNQE